MVSGSSPILWVSTSTIVALLSLNALIPLNERVAQSANPAIFSATVVRNKRMMAGIFILSAILGLLSAPHTPLSTPVINHYLYQRPILWGHWWENVGNAVFGAITLIYISQVILHRTFRHDKLILVTPDIKERFNIVIYDATFEVGLELYGWLSILLWITQQIYGAPQVFLSLCSVALMSIVFHLWVSASIRRFSWALFWNTVFTQLILVFIFGLLVVKEGIEAGSMGRAITVAVFLWPRRLMSQNAAREDTAHGE